ELLIHFLAAHRAVTVPRTCFAMFALAVLAGTLTLTAFIPCFAVAVSLACRTVIAFAILTALAIYSSIDRAYYRRPCHRPHKDNSKKDYSKLFKHIYPL